MDAMQDALSWLGLDSDLWARILWTTSAFVAAIAFNMLLRRLAAARVRNAARRYAINKAIKYTAGCAVLLALTLIWSESATTIATYLGIVSAGVAIALHDPLTNLAGWLFLIVRRPFVVGDRIEIGAHAGDVIDVRMFQFSLVEIGNWVDADQSTGRILHMPNALVFREPISNYTEGFNFIWDEIPVTVTFESNWQRAKEILTEIVNQHSAIPSDAAAAQVRDAARTYLIRYHHLTPIVWTAVADIGVTLTMRYLCEPRRRRSVGNDIWESVLTVFAAADDIDFAYPTQRFYDNQREGKPGAGGATDS